jgi:citrate synthase
MVRLNTHIAHATADRIVIRGVDLVEEIIGKRSFTEMLYFLSVGRNPTVAQVAILDACLVTLMEHGWTPSSVITRLVLESVPGEMQVALAAGLLALGPVYAGTAEDCAKLLCEITDTSGGSDDRPARTANDLASAIVTRYRNAGHAIPGFGHPLHKPNDPRALRLLQLADDMRITGQYVAALRTLSSAVDATYKKHITINATGAIAALLLEIQIPPDLMRGMAVVSRSGGLIGHVKEERVKKASREIWRFAEENIPYSEQD